MRRRTRRKTIFIKPFLMFILLLTVFGVGYSYLSTSLSIRGNVSGINISDDYIIDPSSNPNLDINKFKVKKWEENGIIKTEYGFDVINISDQIYDGFKLTISFSTNVDSIDIWGYNHSFNDNVLTIISNEFGPSNNQKAKIGFITTSKYNINTITIKLDVLGDNSPINLDNFTVDFKITTSWGKYIYQYDVIVSNQTGGKINYWQLEIILPSNTKYMDGWDADFQVNNDTLIVSSTSYNSKLENNESVSFGLQLKTDIINFIPSNIRIIVG